MKPTNLSKSQESKLLEMSRELFTNYYRIDIKEELLVFYRTENDWIIATEPKAKTADSFVIIPWFEFCMTYLPNRLIEKCTSDLDEEITQEFFINMVCCCLVENKEHIVDYLFDEFKETENGKKV